MAFKNNISSINYLEEDTGFNTKLTIYKYQRPRPGANLLKQNLGTLTLPLPLNMPSDQYGVQLGPDNLGLVGGNVTEFDASKGESLTKMQQTIKERLGATGVVGDVGASLVGLLAVAPNITDALDINTAAQSVAGIVRNPHTALLFNNVNLRQFNFSWRFSPRSQEQSKKLESIISTLKKSMHPNWAIGGFAFDYPNLFKLSIGNEREGIVSVDYSFMHDLSINATPNGHAYYRDGYPTVVDISFSLHEIRIKTAEDFYDYSSSSDGPSVSSSNPRGPR